MKKVLILAYDFPPYVSVGGLRPYSWYKYFHEFGLYPVVVTRQWGNKYGNHLDYVAAGESNECVVEETAQGTIIRTPYKPNLSNRLLLKYGENRFKIVRKIITAFYEFAQWVIIIGPKAGLYKGAEEYLNKNKVDCIIATGSPFVLFKYASRLSVISGVPWVADYRDPWSESISHGNSVVGKMLSSFFEKKIIRNASLIITVSDFVKSKIEKVITSKIIRIIPNGYDKDNIEKASMVNQNAEILSIGFAGSVYPWHPIKSILAVFNSLIQNGFLFQVNFYGVNIEGDIKRWISEDFDCLNEYVSVIPRLPNQEVLSRMSKDNVLLLLNYYSYMGTKIYDYIGLKRKILFCYKDDVEANKLRDLYYNIESVEGLSESLQEDLIRETNSGIVVNDSIDLYNVVIDLIKEHSIKRKVDCDSVSIERFSRKKLANIFVDVLKTELDV